MAKTRGLTALLLVASLAGCADREAVEKLRIERDQLQQQLATQQAQRAADLAYWERQASIAAGCDYGVPLCPDSVVAQGRQAQAEGYGGGTSPWFWLAFVLKWVAGLGGLGAMFGVAVLMWIRLISPARDALERAQSTIQEEQAKAAAARQQATIARQQEAQLQASIEVKAQRHAELDQQIEAKELALANLEREAEKTRALKKTLNDVF